MGDATEPTVWQEITGRLPALVELSTPPSLPSTAVPPVLVPATDGQMMDELAPCLQLVAPAGMDRETQAAWFDAAMLALAGYPADLIRRGAKAAMLKADHPSKIVPLIVAEIGEAWRWRKQTHSPRPVARLPAPKAAPVPYEETQRILREAGLDLTEFGDARPPRPIGAGSDRPSRTPTRADYIRMGVDPAVLDHTNTEA